MLHAGGLHHLDLAAGGGVELGAEAVDRRDRICAAGLAFTA